MLRPSEGSGNHPLVVSLIVEVNQVVNKAVPALVIAGQEGIELLLAGLNDEEAAQLLLSTLDSFGEQLERPFNCDCIAQPQGRAIVAHTYAIVLAVQISAEGDSLSMRYKQLPVTV